MTGLNNLPPELQIEQAALLRRQQIANALMQRGMQQRPTQMAGRVAVQQSPLEGAASMLNVVNARSMDDEVTGGMKDIAKRYREQTEQDFEKFSGDSDRAAAVKRALISQNPTVRKLAELEWAQMNKAPDKVDAGDRWLLLRNGVKVGEIMKAATPDTLARNDVTRRGQNLTYDVGTQRVEATRRGQDIGADTARRGQNMSYSSATRGQDIAASTARRGQDLNYDIGTQRIDTTRRGQDLGQLGDGYTLGPDGSAKLIPGTKQAREAAGADIAADTKMAGFDQKYKTVTTAVDEALTKTGGWTATGTAGGILQYLPGSPAFNLARTVDTIKANIGFDRLQEMREASPTGGALGQVAVQELNALQASIASLDVGQKREQLDANLNKITTHYNNWKRIMNQAYQQRPRVTPMPGNGIKFLGYE